MSLDDPLPFRLSIPSEESADLDGSEISVTYQLHGLLYLADDVLAFEWVVKRRTETDSLFGGDLQEDESPIGTISIPRPWIAHVQVRGAWWAPRVQMWARRIDAFDGIPGARPGALTLRIRRRDLPIARAIAAAMTPRHGTAVETEESC
jgi:hypothetical protein